MNSENVNNEVFEQISSNIYRIQQEFSIRVSQSNDRRQLFHTRDAGTEKARSPEFSSYSIRMAALWALNQGQE